METMLLILVVSLDAFVASIAYGSKKIKIPFPSILIINIVSSLFLGLSILFGFLLKRIIPGNITTTISFFLLFILGIYSLFESLIKGYLSSRPNSSKKVKLKLFDISFIINIYIDETKADFDDSKKLDSKEALYLGTALSLDSLTIGFSNSFGNINYLYTIVFSMIVGIMGVRSGLLLGEKIVKKSNINLSWLAGTILIVLAFLKLI